MFGLKISSVPAILRLISARGTMPKAASSVSWAESTFKECDVPYSGSIARCDLCVGPEAWAHAPIERL